MPSKFTTLSILSAILFLVGAVFFAKFVHLDANSKEPTIEFSSSYVNEFSMRQDSWPHGILVDKAGTVWVLGTKIHELYEINPKKNEVNSFQINNNGKLLSDQSLMAWTILEDNEDIIWFSLQGSNPIWRFEPNAKKFDSFDASGTPFQMKEDKDGNIWFTTLTSNTVGVIQKTHLISEEPEYKIIEFVLDSDQLPSGIFFEGDHVWITMIKTNNIVEFLPIKDSDGFVTELTKLNELPNKKNLIHSPTDALFLKNSFWISEHGTSFVSRIQSDSQNVQKFPTSQNQFNATSLPFWIRADQAGNGFWFNEHTGNKIGYFDTTKMELIEFNIPSKPTDGYLVLPLSIATDPTDDDLLWFSEWNTDKIGVVNKKTPIPFLMTLVNTENNSLEDNPNSIKTSILITKNVDNFDGMVNPVFLSSSSSLELNGGLGNMTVIFSKNNVNLTEANDYLIDVLFQNIPDKDHKIISISGTDGQVTRSMFFELTNNTLDLIRE